MALPGFVQRPMTLRVCRVAIGLVFVAAGLAKIVNVGTFAEQIHYFRILPVWSENLLAITLPWIEVVAGMALILKIRERSGAIVVAAMMVVFTVAVGAAVVRGLDIECGCFGTADGTKTGLGKLVGNVGMLAVALVATLKPR